MHKIGEFVPKSLSRENIYRMAENVTNQAVFVIDYKLFLKSQKHA
jgi:hypothetical protein